MVTIAAGIEGCPEAGTEQGGGREEPALLLADTTAVSSAHAWIATVASRAVIPWQDPPQIDLKVLKAFAGLVYLAHAVLCFLADLASSTASLWPFSIARVYVRRTSSTATIACEVLLYLVPGMIPTLLNAKVWICTIMFGQRRWCIGRNHGIPLV